MSDRDPVPAASVSANPSRQRRRLLVGTALCSTFLLVHCSKPDRDFDAILPGAGGKKGSGGSGPGGDNSQGGDPPDGGSTSPSGGSGNFGGDPDLGGASSGGKASGGATASGGETSSGGAPACEDTSDPDCKCVNGELFAKDVDGDGEGSRLCEAAPGQDCDDGDKDFIKNACGGCVKNLGGEVDAPCGQCGTYQCQGDSTVVCKSPTPQPKDCSDLNTPRLCVDGNWVVQSDCGGGTPVCLNGGCVQCNPGSPVNPLGGNRQYLCDTTSYSPDDIIFRCSDGGYWESSWFASCFASSAEVCDAATGTCKSTGIMHPRDLDFDVVPELLKGRRNVEGGRPVLEVFDSLLGSKFG